VGKISNDRFWKTEAREKFEAAPQPFEGTLGAIDWKIFQMPNLDVRAYNKPNTQFGHYFFGLASFFLIGSPLLLDILLKTKKNFKNLKIWPNKTYQQQTN